jgi:hypothetical protein
MFLSYLGCYIAACLLAFVLSIGYSFCATNWWDMKDFNDRLTWAIFLPGVNVLLILGYLTAFSIWLLKRIICSIFDVLCFIGELLASVIYTNGPK